jgi:hypothetical protein
LLIRNPVDFSRSRDQRVPGSFLPKRKDSGYEVGFSMPDSTTRSASREIVSAKYRWLHMSDSIEFSHFDFYSLGVKKNTCGSGSRPTLFFSADPIIFSTRLTVRPYFLRVVAGCCQNGVCCHTNY